MPGSACTEEYGRSPHSPIAYLKLLSLPASLPATAIPPATTATATTESPIARIFRIDLPPKVSYATPQWRAAPLPASLCRCRVTWGNSPVTKPERNGRRCSRKLAADDATVAELDHA